MEKAVVLAAGLGNRMRRPADAARLSSEQAAVAATGIKALIPVGRPFLDYVLTRVADAGYRQVCLVIAPHHDEMRHYYGGLACRRLRIEFAVQTEPLGTAHAVAAAETFVQQDAFMVINSDNCYPAAAMRSLRLADGPAVVGFDRRAMLRDSQLASERLAKFGLIDEGLDRCLRGVQEKPPPDLLERLPDPVLVSMNCWRFGPEIFTACRSIAKSPRGEYEIPDAVMYSIEHLGQRYQVVRCEEGVLDLSGRGDVEVVARQLAGEEVRL